MQVWGAEALLNANRSSPVRQTSVKTRIPTIGNRRAAEGVSWQTAKEEKKEEQLLAGHPCVHIVGCRLKRDGIAFLTGSPEHYNEDYADFADPAKWPSDGGRQKPWAQPGCWDGGDYVENWHMPPMSRASRQLFHDAMVRGTTYSEHVMDGMWMDEKTLMQIQGDVGYSKEAQVLRRQHTTPTGMEEEGTANAQNKSGDDSDREAGDLRESRTEAPHYAVILQQIAKKFPGFDVLPWIQWDDIPEEALVTYPASDDPREVRLARCRTALLPEWVAGEMGRNVHIDLLVCAMALHIDHNHYMMLNEENQESYERVHGLLKFNLGALDD